MRAACRKFLGDVEDDRQRRDQPVFDWFATSPAWVFQQALGELRGVVGVHVAQVAARYGLDVPDTLAPILPAADAD